MPNKPSFSENISCGGQGSLPERLKKRSQLLQTLRAFFYARAVIEVDTPMLSQAGVPDVHLHSLFTDVRVPGETDRQRYYLHTSPEYPMKRLLCEGSGDIFYLGKVFRDGDLSPRHQVEFTMLEWYRIGFSMFDLMDEVVELIQAVLPEEWSVERLSYKQAFQRYAGIDDIGSATAQECMDCLNKHGVPEIVGVDEDDKALWEQLVLTEVIEAQLGQGAISVLYHYPARDAALAQISEEDPTVAERFEVFVNGMELANGYHELADAELYRQRFEASLAQRKGMALPSIPLDERLLQTLEDLPLPDCSGVALGVDRLFALQQGYEDIRQGIAFGLKDA
ncbi:EF-P lysine aminoacylase EpmA [Thiomicrorhabdus sp. ZW0627]|uniref:EF-P lysine aminoacylase EpmA n=1 Tax=Thiomicrorhabdus sp. ZW0627 TaxID=3039774 RepID=UPI00243731D7|nr:EF-P lysine aminoacylase EpmA [Thiomicrorhabdus sp. ZW0627]MDG6773958.1 EF-P lysine aminoacylase EpmA [Thiomicrorhabdus sp. ZW0627]